MWNPPFFPAHFDHVKPWLVRPIYRRSVLRGSRAVNVAGGHLEPLVPVPDTDIVEDPWGRNFVRQRIIRGERLALNDQVKEGDFRRGIPDFLELCLFPRENLPQALGRLLAVEVEPEESANRVSFAGSEDINAVVHEVREVLRVEDVMRGTLSPAGEEPRVGVSGTLRRVVISRQKDEGHLQWREVGLDRVPELQDGKGVGLRAVEQVPGVDHEIRALKGNQA